MWDERYNTDEYVYGREPNGFLREHADALPKGRILCLAEGEGRNSVYLATKGYEVIGVDSSSVGLKKAQLLAKDAGVTITTVLADLADYPIAPGSFDGAVSIFCHLPKGIRSALHQRVIAGLQRGGVLLLEAYTPKQLQYRTGGPQNVALLMTLDELKQELNGLEFVLGQEIDRDVVEGNLHSGRAAVVQVIGRKV